MPVALVITPIALWNKLEMVGGEVSIPSRTRKQILKNIDSLGV